MTGGQVVISLEECLEGVAYLEAIQRGDETALAALEQRWEDERRLPQLVAATGQWVVGVATLLSVPGGASMDSAELQSAAAERLRAPEGRMRMLLVEVLECWAADSVQHTTDAERIARALLRLLEAVLPTMPLPEILDCVRINVLAHPLDTPVSPVVHPTPRPHPYLNDEEPWPAVTGEDIVYGLDAIRAVYENDPSGLREVRTDLAQLRRRLPPLSVMVAEAGAAAVETVTMLAYRRPAAPDDAGIGQWWQEHADGRVRMLLASVLRKWARHTAPSDPQTIARVVISSLVIATSSDTSDGLLDPVTTALTTLRRLHSQGNHPPSRKT